MPVLLGAGIRLFEHLGVKLIELESIDVIDTPGVTHLQYRVVKVAVRLAQDCTTEERTHD